MKKTITRRKFLNKATSIIGASAFAGHHFSSADSSSPIKKAQSRKIKKALKYHMVKSGSTVLDKFKLIRDLGYDGLEILSPNDIDNGQILRARDATGLEIHGTIGSAHWKKRLSDPDPKVREMGLEAFKTTLKDCKRYGGSTALLVPGKVTAMEPYDLVYERSQNEIRKLLPLAEELGVKIAIENVWNNFLLSPLEAARYIDELNSPWVGWYLDVGNLVRNAWPEQWIRILGKRILKLDIKEYSRQLQLKQGLSKGFQVKLGDGDCNWPEVMKALDEIGFEGWATAEIKGGDAKWLRDIAQRMDKVLFT